MSATPGHAERAKAPTPGGAAPAVNLAGLTKTFGKGRTAVHALRGVDMVVPAGQLLMLVGPSGCGKTTLVSIISGVLDADGGRAEVFGVDWSTLSGGRKTIRRGELVGFVFQQFNLIPTLTALENVSVPLLVRGVDRHEARERAAASLREVGLGERMEVLPSNLSGGMQQRVAIARALVGRPRLLVCDEPTANLDGQTGQMVMELIHTAARSTDAAGLPRCVIVVTHDSRIFHYADRIEEMEDGRLKDRPSQVILDEAKYIPHYDAPSPDDNEQEGQATTPPPAPRNETRKQQ